MQVGLVILGAVCANRRVWVLAVVLGLVLALVVGALGADSALAMNAGWGCRGSMCG